MQPRSGLPPLKFFGCLAAVWRAEYRIPIAGEMGYVGVDANYRSSTYADVSDSRFLQIDGYNTVNLRAGLITTSNWEFVIWQRMCSTLTISSIFKHSPAIPGPFSAFSATLVRWGSPCA